MANYDILGIKNWVPAEDEEKRLRAQGNPNPDLINFYNAIDQAMNSISQRKTLESREKYTKDFAPAAMKKLLQDIAQRSMMEQAQKNKGQMMEQESLNRLFNTIPQGQPTDPLEELRRQLSQSKGVWQ